MCQLCDWFKTNMTVARFFPWFRGSFGLNVLMLFKYFNHWEKENCNVFLQWSNNNSLKKKKPCQNIHITLFVANDLIYSILKQSCKIWSDFCGHDQPLILSWTFKTFYFRRGKKAVLYIGEVHWIWNACWNQAGLISFLCY